MPLSRLDLSRIVEAIRELYRAVEYPPAENWQAPDWLMVQYNRLLAQGELGIPPPRPIHAYLINAAAAEVLYRIKPPNWVLPPLQHRETDCPEITESSLDLRHKVTLLELWGRLQDWRIVTGDLAENRGEALKLLAFLETVLTQLSSEPPKGTGAAGDQGGAGQGGGGEQPGKRGRKSRCNRQKDREIADDWKRAKGAGTAKKQYASDNNLSLRDLNRILNRHAKRGEGDAKRKPRARK
jgi:hypothetical protein